MRSNSPFRQDKCATGWAKMKAGYKDKEEYKKEKNEYHCNESTKYKVVMKEKDDSEKQVFIKEKKTSMAEEKQQSK
jgi:membrane-bound inhibitor of C-type lysozyme